MQSYFKYLVVEIESFDSCVRVLLLARILVLQRRCTSSSLFFEVDVVAGGTRLSIALIPIEIRTSVHCRGSAHAVSRPQRVRRERPPVPLRRSLRLGRSFGEEPAGEGFRVLGDTGAQNDGKGDSSKDHQLIRKSRLAATTTNDSMKSVGSQSQSDSEESQSLEELLTPPAGTKI